MYVHICIHFPLILKITLPLFLFPSYLDLSPARLHPLYTSKSWPLKVPCSFLAHISWQQIKAKDIQEVLWDFVPRSGSSPQRLFNLSLENPLTWKPDQNRGLRPVSDPQKGDLSLTRNRGREEDSGDYECALKFKNGVTLKRTVHVEVLQSKSTQTALYKPSSVLHSHLSYFMTFLFSLFFFVIAGSSFIF